MLNRIDWDDDDVQIHDIGTLDEKVIQLLNLNINETTIALGADRKKYIESIRTISKVKRTLNGTLSLFLI